MANDPNRDAVPVKEGSLVDTCRSSIDPRERHLVCKWDRYELEDKYLTLLNEANNLKKLYNAQDVTVKKLSAKLIRLSHSTKPISGNWNIHEDGNRLNFLESENVKLKDKVAVLKSQLLNHKLVGASTVKSRRPYSGLPSGTISYQAESTRTRLSSGRCNGQKGDEGEPPDYQPQNEDTNIEKKDMSSRIEQLEKELADHVVGNQKEKIAENVEHIKVWRQIHQVNDKLLTAEETNQSLHKEIDELKKIIEETTKNNKEISVSLSTERKRLAELDEEILKAKNSQLASREKDEQIRSLQSELKILQHHNQELISLSSRYGQMEHENMELKKKLSDQMQDQETLKTVFTSEKATISALQNANEQLSSKLQDFQKNVDFLTDELKTLKKDVATNVYIHQLEHKGPEKCGDKVKCQKCCEVFEKVSILEKAMNTVRDTWKTVDAVTQTDHICCEKTFKDQSTYTTMDVGIHVDSAANQSRTEFGIQPRSPLSKEEMLKLLDDVEIGTPKSSKRHSQGSNNDFTFNSTKTKESKLAITLFILIVSHSDLFNIFLSLQKEDNQFNIFTMTFYKSVKITIYYSSRTIERRSRRYMDKRNYRYRSISSMNVISSSWIRNNFLDKRASSAGYDDGPSKRVKIFEQTCSCEDTSQRKFCIHRFGPPIPFSISADQGLLEVHVLRLRLSGSAMKLLMKERNLCDLEISISCLIWDQEEVSTPLKKYPSLAYDRSFVYRIPNLIDFLERITNDCLSFEASCVNENGITVPMAKARLDVKDILDYSQNKLHYVASMNSIEPRFSRISLGQLSIWIRLSCDHEKVEDFKKIHGLPPHPQGTNNEVPLSHQIEHNQEEIDDNEKNLEPDLQSCGRDFLHIVLFLIPLNFCYFRWSRRRSTDIQAETESITEFNEVLANVRIPENLQESCEDLREIISDENWLRYKRRSRLIFSDQYPPIFVEISEVTLFQNTSLMKDDDVKMLYVEYSFLGCNGEDMETNSQEKPNAVQNKIAYNYRKEFPLDKEIHSLQRAALISMLTGVLEPFIDFILVSEPLPEETDYKECVEVGFSRLNLKEYAKRDEGNNVLLPIVNHMGNEELGVIMLKIQGIKEFCIFNNSTSSV
ncbi:uncharacterized protein [Prorops nasuta]|uniref:uncharacterized protein n=1 Tax=Prorops nasuta TaxID=863751 RepID=UPI0034CE842F